MNRTADFESYISTCERCDKRFHASGVDVCDCAVCEKCGDVKAGTDFPGHPDTLREVVCISCIDDADNDCDGDDDEAIA